jgi:hypothetical protein
VATAIVSSCIWEGDEIFVAMSLFMLEGRRDIFELRTSVTKSVETTPRKTAREATSAFGRLLSIDGVWVWSFVLVLLSFACEKEGKRGGVEEFRFLASGLHDDGHACRPVFCSRLPY